MDQQITKVRHMADIIPIDGKAGKKANKPEPDLTNKQRGFADDVGINMMTLADAYRENYSVLQMTDKSIHECASRLFANVKVKARIDALREAKTNRALVDGATIRDELLQKLLEKAGMIEGTAAETDATQLTAMQMIGKFSSVAAFTDRSEVLTADVTPEDLQAELEQALKQAIGKV